MLLYFETAGLVLVLLMMFVPFVLLVITAWLTDRLSLLLLVVLLLLVLVIESRLTDRSLRSYLPICREAPGR